VAFLGQAEESHFPKGHPMFKLLQKRKLWIVIFALLWPAVTQVPITLIAWMRSAPGVPVFGFNYGLRFALIGGVISGFFLGWVFFVMLDRARTRFARILTILSCLISTVFSGWAMVMTSFVQIWFYLPIQISRFVNEVLTVILVACSGFATAAIITVAGFGLSQALNWALSRSASPQ
jgi:hypothetical protein